MVEAMSVDKINIKMIDRALHTLVDVAYVLIMQKKINFF